MCLPPLYTLVVKGDKFTAAHAAADRGIPAVFLRETTTDTLLVTRAGFTKLVKWLAERPALLPGQGFPVGTLLLYSEHKDATLASIKAGV